jgi:hypothetical protein
LASRSIYLELDHLLSPGKVVLGMSPVAAWWDYNGVQWQCLA